MCTDFLLQSKDGAFVNGRSMEFGQELHSQVYFHAAGSSGILKGFDGDDMEMKPAYSYVGTSTAGTDICNDGMNSVGLSTGALWLPGSQYQDMSLLHPHRNVLCGFFVNWMLGHCATTDDVRHALENDEIRVVGDKYIAKHAPLHFPVHDAGGNSIVIEFLEGKPVIKDNDVAVLTNRPIFTWQLANLGNYTNLTPWDTESITLGIYEAGNNGHGTGLAGIPGNSTPPSRFVRTAYLKQFALPTQTADEAQALAFHLLNAVDIPLGTVRSLPKSSSDCMPNANADIPKGTEFDYTQWVVVKDLKNLTFDIRMYGSPLAWRVDLKTLDFDKLNGRHIPVPQGQPALPLPLA